MEKLAILCCMLLLTSYSRSCNFTIDSIVNENNDTRLEWSRTITIDSIDGSDSVNCLFDQSVHCKTLAFVLNNINKYSTQSPCLKLVLNKNSSSHLIPYNAPPLSRISLYFVSEEDALITCDNNTGSAATAWSIQNANFVVFKSLHFSSCNRRLEIANISNVYFENIQVSEFADSGLRLFNNFNVTLKNLIVMHCSHNVTNHFPENSALSVVYRSSGRKMSHIRILNSKFLYNKIEVPMFENTDESIMGDKYPGRGGALGIFITEPIKNAAIEIIIDECNFTNNTADVYGGAIYLVSNQLSSGHICTIINSVFDRNYAAIGGGGFSQGTNKAGNFTIDTVFKPSNYLLENCNFTQNSAQFGGAVGFIIALNRKRTTDTVSINNCIFDGNVGSFIGAAVMISSLTYPHLPEQDFPYNISNCTFKNNTSPRGVLGITFKDLDFYGTNHFIKNHGPSIIATDSIIAIHGNINFSHNVAGTFNEGVIHLQDFVQFQLYSGSHMYFHNNTAKATAVFAIFLQEYPRVFSQLVNNPWCFLLYEDEERAPSDWVDVDITFDSNEAELARNMYISNLNLCSWQNTSHDKVHFSDEEVLKWPVFNFHDLTINKDTTSIVYNDSASRGIYTAAVNITGKKSQVIRPGKPFELELVPRDRFGNPTGLVFGFTQLTKNKSMPTGRVAQFIDLSNNQDKDVLLEPNIEDYLPGQNKLELTCSLSPKNSSLKNFTIAVFTAVKLEVSNLPLSYVSITVDKCLPGKTLRKADSDSTTLTCECDFKGTHGTILSCKKNEEIILRDGFIGSYHPSQIFSTLKVLPCPPAYCQCRKESINSTSCNAVYNFVDEQQQCHPDREGVLCGHCRHSHQGVGVLTMLCQNCDNYNLVVMPILVLLDVVLVILILCSATPFPPPLKGILFYIQAMSRAVTSFPLSTWRGNQYMLYISSALSLYFPWDFCLYEGITALASHFFSYTPFFVALIIIILVLKYRPRGYTSPQGKKFQKVYQKFRSKHAHGIWTLILLMFLRVSYNAWSITDCLIISDDKLRWYYDGNVQCFKDYKHMLLFVLGLIVMLFTSLLMIFVGFLTLGALDGVTDKYATCKHLRKSASYGYKEKYQWWPFVDIGRRFLLVFFWVTFPGPVYTTLQLFIFFTIFLVHIYAQPYEKAWHNWLDSFLLLYLIILLLLRSTNFITESLLMNGYTGLMLPSQNTTNRMSSPAENPLPPNDTLTYFFVPLVYLPLVIALVIIAPVLFKLGKHIIFWLHNFLLYCFQKCKASQDTYDESLLSSISLRVYKHDDSGVVVTHRDGRTTKVPTTTVIEF